MTVRKRSKKQGVFLPVKSSFLNFIFSVLKTSVNLTAKLQL